MEYELGHYFRIVKKLFCIADSNGKRFYHPLCPKVRHWNLVKFDIEEYLREEYSND